MSYRSGTYVAFHAAGTSDPTQSDMKYYRTLQMWDKNNNHDFHIINSHDKTSAVRDSSLKTTLEDRILERLRNSKNMILIIGDTTRLDTDWVPFEIRKAIDLYEIPIIAAYTKYEYIQDPALLSNLWPIDLAIRIHNSSAHVIHIPFKEKPIMDAIGQFTHDKYPLGIGLGIYSKDAYRSFGIIIP